MTDTINKIDAINRVAVLIGGEVHAGELAHNAGHKLATDIAGAIAGEDSADVLELIEGADEAFHKAVNGEA